MVQTTACFSVQGQRGGCTGKKRGGVPAPHSLKSFVFRGLSLLIGFPRADTEKSGETIATPPETGVPTGPDSGTEYRASIRPQGVAIVGIYPCGKARSNPPEGGADGKGAVSLFPSPWMIPDRSSPSRVRFAASRPGLLRADPKGWLFMREKGGLVFRFYPFKGWFWFWFFDPVIYSQSSSLLLLVL